MTNNYSDQLCLFEDEIIVDEVAIPKRTIRLATLFSGIGAIEQTFLKMNINHEIVFACDNGEREISQSRESIEKLLSDVHEEENIVGQN
jgi:hypothetical protein